MATALDTLVKRLNDVCYQYVLLHLDKYGAEKDIEKCLPLMEPATFAGFAVRACQDVAGLVLAAARDQYRSQTAPLSVLTVAVREHAVPDGDDPELLRMLGENLNGFNNDLRQYSVELVRFRQALVQAKQATWNSGFAAADWASSIFSGFAVVIGAAASGFLAGSAIDRQMEAECGQIQHAFDAMLQSYDRTMASMVRMAVDMIAGHCNSLADAVRQACA